jgi:hypothetical protein
VTPIELTEDEVRDIIMVIEDFESTIKVGNKYPNLQNARHKLHKLYMSLMEKQVPADTKFIEDGKEYQFLRDELIKVRNSCLGLTVFDADGAIILSHTIRWLSFKIEGKPYERTTD